MPRRELKDQQGVHNISYVIGSGEGQARGATLELKGLKIKRSLCMFHSVKFSNRG
jgi:hypothetical protein